MKKILRFIPLMLIAAVSSIMLWSCDDNDDVISVDKLPSQAQAFISQYFPSAKIVSTHKDVNEYDVILSDGTQIEFNKTGEWTDVDAPVGKTIPNGFYPDEIDIYVGLNFNGEGINEISKEIGGYEVELVSGTDLLFGYDGSFIGHDR